MQTLRVALGERSYPIHIGEGLLDDGSLLAPHLVSGRAVIVTNTVVAPLYLARVSAAVRACGATSVDVVLEDGENTKNWDSLDRIIDCMLAARCDRQSVLIALGGGVVGDLAGFAAAIYQRGIAFIQMPTTLLAQVDSSVGGKTAINHPRGKNMVGAFHQPSAVISDVAALATLPPRELRAGAAEVIKHGLALDAEFTSWLESNIARLLAGQPAALTHAVRRSCELKAEVVAADEREAGVRALLNLGHTFGHAIESATGYGEWLHGEAVAAGMVMAAELSSRVGLLTEAGVARVRDLIGSAGLPVAGPALAADRYLEYMAIDKKVSDGRINFILLEELGAAVLRGDVDLLAVRAAIEACSTRIAATHQPEPALKGGD